MVYEMNTIGKSAFWLGVARLSSGLKLGEEPIIFGCRAAGLDELEDFLELAFGKEFLVTYDNLFDKVDFGRRLSDLSNREKDGVTLVLVLPTCLWSEYWVNEAVEKVHALKSKSKFVRIVFVADPQLTWQLLSPTTPVLNALIKQGATIFSLQPWHDTALRQWLEDCGFGPRDQGGRKRLTAVTGNWPLLLGEFYQRCKSDPHRWERSLQELEEDLKKPFAQDVAELGEASLEELITVIEGLPSEVVQQSLSWSDLLHLTTPVKNGCWCVDDIVARILPVIGK